MHRASRIRSSDSRPPKRKLPPNVEQVVPEAALYGQLLALEKGLESALTRRRLTQVTHSSLPMGPTGSNNKLRIHVHVKENGPPGQYHVLEEDKSLLDDKPSWTLRIEGVWMPGSGVSDRKMTSFVKNLFIQLENEDGESIEVIEWTNDASDPQDGFSIRRPHRGEHHARIVLHLDYPQTCWSVPTRLSHVLGFQLETKDNILHALWRYVRTNRLLTSDHKVSLNAVLAQALRSKAATALESQPQPQSQSQPQQQRRRHVPMEGDTITFATLTELVDDVLTPPKPIDMHYDVASGEARVYDVLMPLEPVEDVPHSSQESRTLDVEEVEKVNAAHASVEKHMRLRAAYESFAKDPIPFMHQVMDSQLRDAKAASISQVAVDGITRRSAFYQHPFVADAVDRYLSEYDAHKKDT